MNKFFKGIAMNIPVRFRNWAFWLGLIATIMAAMNVSPEMLTSWDILWHEIIALFGNPFRLGCVIVSIIGVFVDPTTCGIGDSKQAMTYEKPFKE